MMFRHIFVHRLKCQLRDKPNLFWTLLYPIVLATFFALAFSNLANGVSFSSIPVAVVDNEELSGEPYFLDVLCSVPSEGVDGQKLFSVTRTTREDAEKRLDTNEIRGYVVFDGGAHVVVKSSGIEQTILKEFMDSYLQTAAAYANILGQNPSAAQELFGAASETFVEKVDIGGSDTSFTVVSFYALISMAAMFGGFWGVREVEDIQADLTDCGARLNLSPVHKMKAFGYSLCAAVLIHIIALLILVAYIALVLRVNFGHQLFSIMLTCIVSGILGVSFGAFVSALIKGKSGFRIAIVISVSLVCSSLAGMVYPGIKYIVVKAVPILAYINPANLVTDAFYALMYYSSSTRFFINIALMAAFSAVFFLGVYLVMRRRKYASL
jgi:ABC-2 type transport system permease protein